MIFIFYLFFVNNIQITNNFNLKYQKKLFNFLYQSGSKLLSESHCLDRNFISNSLK